MAIKRYVYTENDADWIDTAAERIEKMDKGTNKISYTDFADSSVVMSITSGSYFEIAGSGYLSDTDTEVASGEEATGLCYILATGSTAACTIAWTTTAPTWRDDFQGYYATVASTVRALGGCTYDGNSYDGRWVYEESRADGIPEGIIVAQIPGYFGDGSNGSYTAVAITNNSKWKVCDGAALNDPLSLIFNGAGRYLPNLTDDRFLMGDTFGAIGGIGGNNTMAHTHTYPDHKHQIAHYDYTSANEKDLYFYDSAGTNRRILGSYAEFGTGSAYYIKFPLTTDYTLYSKTDGSGNTGAASNTENRPTYLSCQYLMKVRA